MTSRLLAVAVLLAAFAAPASAQLSRDSKLLAPFKPIVAKAGESTVRVKCNDKDAILGTVVDGDGYILTKLSELKGTVSVRLSDGSEYEASRVAEHKDTDLALLKVDVKGLKPVKFADTKAVPRGFWVAASGPTSDPVSVGIVSVMTRKLTGRDANPGYLGIFPEDAKDGDGKGIGARITRLTPDGVAQKTGLKVDDVIFEINGKAVTTQTSLREVLRTFKGGSAIELKVKRGGEDKAFKLTLDGPPKEPRGDMQNSMGTTLSARRIDFPLVLQTDMVVDAKDCGGPVVDLEGNVLGINIARAGRVETWVLPGEVIRPLLADFKAGKFAAISATTGGPKLPVAPAPRVKSK